MPILRFRGDCPRARCKLAPQWPDWFIQSAFAYSGFPSSFWDLIWDCCSPRIVAPVPKGLQAVQGTPEVHSVFGKEAKNEGGCEHLYVTLSSIAFDLASPRCRVPIVPHVTRRLWNRAIRNSPCESDVSSGFHLTNIRNEHDGKDHTCPPREGLGQGWESECCGVEGFP